MESKNLKNDQPKGKSRREKIEFLSRRAVDEQDLM